MAAELLRDLSRASDDNNAPLASATWNFYVTGTSTPLAVYSDAALSTSLGAVVTADAGGKFVPIFFNAALEYRGILKNAAGTTIQDIDPINDGVFSQLASTASGKGAALVITESGDSVETVLGQRVPTENDAAGVLDYRSRAFTSGASVISIASTDPKTDTFVQDIRVDGVTGSIIAAQAEFDVAYTLHSRFEGGLNRVVQHGGNTLDQATRKRSVMLGNFAQNVTGNASQCIPFLSYARSSLMAFNEVDGFGDGSTTGEIDAFYTKSPYALMLGNVARNGTTTSGSRYYMNLKGEPRGSASNEGYGGTMAFNLSIGDGTGNNQVEEGEGAILFNIAEDMATAFEFSSGKQYNVRNIGNYVYGATTQGLSFVNDADVGTGGNFVGGFNLYDDVAKGITIKSTGYAFHGATVIGDHINVNAVASAVTVEGHSAAAPLSGVALAHLKLQANGANPIFLKNVDGVVIDSPRIRNTDTANADKIATFNTAATNALINNAHRSIALTGNTTLTVFGITLLADMVCSYEFIVNGRSDDGTKAFAYRVEGSCWYDGTTLRDIDAANITGSAIDDTGTPVVMDGATTQFPSGGTLRFRMRAAAGNDWTGFARLTLTIH